MEISAKSFAESIWQDTIVDCAIFHNEAGINNYFEVYVLKDYIERTTGKKEEEIEIRTKIEKIWWDYCMNYSKINDYNRLKQDRGEEKEICVISSCEGVG